MIPESENEFNADNYHDEYRERFLAMIDKKVKGQEITLAPAAPGRRTGKVVDIFAGLKQSLEQAASQRQPARQTARKTVRKRRRA